MVFKGLRAVGVVAVTALASLVPAPMSAQAITGGSADGSAHPSVGLVAFYKNGGLNRCTGTLVTPTVVLTAAHCTDGTSGRTVVTFAPTLSSQAPLPRAADPAAGYTTAGVIDPSLYVGTALTHPGYSRFRDKAHWNDVGVVVLDRPVVGIAPARIAPRNYLNRFAQPRLNSTLFTLVGYGDEVRRASSGPRKPTPMTFPLLRRQADAPGQRLTAQILQVNGNQFDPRGTGGTCFGDSGGPGFKNSYLVTVTSYGYNGTCRFLAGLQRVDIGDAQDWLAQFGVRP